MKVMAFCMISFRANAPCILNKHKSKGVGVGRAFLPTGKNGREWQSASYQAEPRKLGFILKVHSRLVVFPGMLLDWTPRCFSTGERLCHNVCYTCNRLLYIKPARLTPDIIGHLRRLGIGSNLPRKRTRRGGSRKQKKIAVLDCDNHRRPSSTTCKQQAHEHGTVNFNNLITVPLFAQ